MTVLDIDALAELQTASFAHAGPGVRSSWPQETAMDAAELGAFLSSQSYCVLATVTARARPIARPMAFLVLDASVWLATVDGSRLRNLRRTPWVSIVISVGDSGEHDAVVIDGPVTISEQPPERVRVAWLTRHGSGADWADAWAKVHPDRLLSYSARKSR